MMGALKEAWEFVDWDNKNANISQYFKVYEALYLPSWLVYHTPSSNEKRSIWEIAQAMDDIRELVGGPIKVHVWIRPVLNCPNHRYHEKDYNKFIKGALKSLHIAGGAVDWSTKRMSCDKVRELLKPQLNRLNLRMEDFPGANWVHTDNKRTRGKRYFKP